MFFGLANLAERTIDQSQSVMRRSEIRIQRTGLAVGFGCARQVVAGSAYPSQSVVGVSIIRVMFCYRGIELTASDPIGGSQQAAR